MTKLVFDNGGIERKILPSLNDTINNLSTASSIASGMSIPDFNEAQTLINVISDLNTIKKNLIRINTWLVTSNKNYESSVELVDEYLLKVRKMTMNLHKKAVK